MERSEKARQSSPSSVQVPAKIICRNLWKIFGPEPKPTWSRLSAAGDHGEKVDPDGHVVAVRGVSFEVKKGSTFVVMGLSGSGKSTMIRCLSRLIEPTAGEVLIDGVDVEKMPTRELIELRRQKMSMVFQHFGLLPHRKVIDNAAFGLEVRGVNRKERHDKAAEILELVGLKGWEDRYPSQLSGGMQQRVGLARALAVEPEILLFDEPFSALDPLIRRDMQDELLRLQSVLHKTMIFITHDFAEAVKMGDEIAIMKDGAVVQTGSPENVLSHPINAYVQKFTEDVPLYNILSAGGVMNPYDPDEDYADTTVNIDSKLCELIPITAATARPVAVIDADGKRVGSVDRKTVLLALSGDRHL